MADLTIGGSVSISASVYDYTSSGGLNNDFFEDDFNRSDADDLGNEWSEDSGNWELQNNQLTTGNEFNSIIRTVETQINPDYTIQTDINITASGDTAGLIGRRIKADQYYAFVIDPENNELSLILENLGSTSVLATESASFEINTDYIIEFRLFKEELKGSIFNSSGLLIGSVSTTDNTITSAGSAGVFFNSGTNGGALPQSMPGEIGTFF